MVANLAILAAPIINPPAHPVETLRILLLIPGILLLVVLNVLFGTAPVPPADAVASLLGGGSETARFVVLESRLPAALTALLAGGALAVGGLVMQTLFRNPLADPSILGISAGAGLGAAIVLLASAGATFAATASAAMVGAVAAIALLAAASAWVRSASALLVVGVMLTCLFGSVTTLLSFFATNEGVRGFVVWGFGNFSSAYGSRLAAYAVAVAVACAFLPFAARTLDALLLGDDYARSVGIRVRLHRTLLLLLVGWLTAVTTAVCGPVAFIGLAVPHAARRMAATALHRRLVPCTVLLGSATSLACLFLTRLPAILHLSPSILPLAAVTPLVGAPAVIAILLRGSR